MEAQPTPECRACTDINCPQQPTSPSCIHQLPSNDSMTFGIELEFVVIAPKNTLSKHILAEAERRWTPVILLQHALLTRGVPAATFHPGLNKICPRCIDIDWKSHSYIEKMARTGTGGSFGRWNIDMDPSARLTDAEEDLVPEGEYETWSLELSSRCFSITDSTWQREVGEVIASFDEIRELGGQVLANRNCGFHLHVGYGDKMVPLTTCKSVLQLTTALERCFDNFHSQYRVIPSTNFFYKDAGHFNTPLGCIHRARAAREGKCEYDIFDTLIGIESVHSYQALCDLFRVKKSEDDETEIPDGHYSLVNFDNTINPRWIRVDREYKKFDPIGTIEFRQQQSTLDAAAVVAWVGLVTTLVGFCNDPRHAKRIIQLCSWAWESERQFGPLRLLEYLECSDAVQAYYTAWFKEQHEPPVDLEAPRKTFTEENAFTNFISNHPNVIKIMISRKKAQGDYGVESTLKDEDEEAVHDTYRLSVQSSWSAGKPCDITGMRAAKLAALQELARRAKLRRRAVES